MSNPIRQTAVEGLKPGYTITYQRTFTQTDTRLFGEMTRDFNPVHYDERWTDEKGFKGLICHGLLIGSMICEFGGQVGWLATGMEFKFIGPVYMGDTIQCCVTITRIQENGRAEARAVFVNQNREKIGLATLSGRLPLKREREILGAMVQEGDRTNPLTDTPYPLLETKKE